MSRERRHELSDAEWARIEPLLPPERGHWGRPRLDNRQMVNGMVWILRTGAPWRDLPERYGPWNTVYTRFYRWSRSGQLQKILEALSDGEMDTYMLDSTIVRAHQQASGAKGGSKRKGSAEAGAGLPAKSTS